MAAEAMAGAGCPARPDAVVLRNVSYAYPGSAAVALSGIDLRVPAGQCVVVTGRSGCGKTTLTRLLNGLVPHVYAGALEGEVRVDGTAVADWGADELGVRVGSVFQNPRSQFVNLDVASEIAFGCENLGMPHQAIVEHVDEAADALGIADLLDRSVEELSGGQKQSVIIASAFAMHPGIFVLDEPTASLDVPSMQRLACTVAALKAQGKTVIVSEHRLWWLVDVADRVVLMEDGAIAGDWTAEEYAALPFAWRAEKGMRAWTTAEMELRADGSALRPGGSEALGDEATGAAEATEGAQAAEAVASAGTAEGAPALEAQRLCVAYRRRGNVLDGLSLDLATGQVLGIVGANGAGKTTLLRTLAGLKREREGEVAAEGRAIRFRDRPQVAHLVMQEPGYQLFADSALAELRLPEAQATQVLREFGLEGRAERHPLSLSGGERQRLAIAAGVAQGAKVLVLDEPTSGLDRANMERVAATLRRVAREGTAVVLVTHDYEFLCAACDEVAEVAAGRIDARYPLDAAHASRVRGQFGFDQGIPDKERSR